MSDSVHPSYEAVHDSNTYITCTPDLHRLLWNLSGPISSSIRVLEDPTNSSSPHQAYQDVTNNTLHEISNSPLTDPKVSSIQVEEYHLADAEACWLELHEGCVEEGDTNGGECEWADEDVEWSEVPDNRLLRCCGTERPRPTVPLLVRPSSSSSSSLSASSFVTIHDFVSAVHPWLSSLKDKIRESITIVEQKPASTASETLLMVDVGPQPNCIRIIEFPASGAGIAGYRADRARLVLQWRTTPAPMLPAIPRVLAAGPEESGITPPPPPFPSADSPTLTILRLEDGPLDMGAYMAQLELMRASGMARQQQQQGGHPPQ